MNPEYSGTTLFGILPPRGDKWRNLAEYGTSWRNLVTSGATYFVA